MLCFRSHIPKDSRRTLVIVVAIVSVGLAAGIFIPAFSFYAGNVNSTLPSANTPRAFFEDATGKQIDIAQKAFNLGDDTYAFLVDHDGLISSPSAPSGLLGKDQKRKNVVIELRSKPQTTGASLDRASLKTILRMQFKTAPRFEYKTVFNGFAVSLKEEEIKILKSNPAVKEVYPDYEFQAFLSNSVPRIKAHTVWKKKDAQNRSVSGEGVVVAIVDTGIDYTHPDLGGCFGQQCKVVGGWDFVNNDADPRDDYGHGTHVAGIVAADGETKGVAPKAKLLAYKVLNETGRGTLINVLAGIERAVDPDGDPKTNDAADVINFSLGALGDPDDPVAQTVDAAFARGVIVVAAAGNWGPGAESVATPAVARGAIAVAAANIDDSVATFSSKGPVPPTFAVKPEVTAPGVNIYSTVPRGEGAIVHPSGYLRLSGTSMAAPHIAGVAALLIQGHPNWSAEEVRAAIVQTSRDLGENLYAQGTGLVDAEKAYDAQRVVLPLTLAAGIDDLSLDTWHKILSVEVKTLHGNESKSPTFSFSFTTPGISVTTVPSGKNHIIDLGVYNTILPFSTNSRDFAGIMEVSSELRVPIAFSVRNVEVQANGFTWAVMAYTDHGYRLNQFYKSGHVYFLIPEGVYNFHTLYIADAESVIQENVSVQKRGLTRVQAKKELARNSIIARAIDETGRAIEELNGRGIMYFYHKKTGAGVIFLGKVNETVRKFSDFSDAYRLEWFGQSFVGDKAYYMRGGIDSARESTVLANNIDEFRKFKFGYDNLQKQPGEVNILRTSYLKLGGGRGSVGFTVLPQPNTRVPTDEESLISLPPFASEAAGVGYFQHRVFSLDDREIYISPQYRLLKGGTLGVFPEEVVETPFFTYSSGSRVRNYAPPFLFTAEFANGPSWVRLRPFVVPAFDDRARYLFTGQERGLIAAAEFPFKLFNEQGVLAQEGELPLSGEYPFVVRVEPGKYEFQFESPRWWLGDGQEGRGIVSATFDTRMSRSDPPQIKSFKIASGKDVVFIPLPDDDRRPDARINFELHDHSLTGSVDTKLFARPAASSLVGGWRELSLQRGNGYTYETDFFGGAEQSSSAYDLRLLARDGFGSELEYTMLNAFETETKLDSSKRCITSELERGKCFGKTRVFSSASGLPDLTDSKSGEAGSSVSSAPAKDSASQEQSTNDATATGNEQLATGDKPDARRQTPEVAKPEAAKPIVEQKSKEEHKIFAVNSSTLTLSAPPSSFRVEPKTFDCGNGSRITLYTMSTYRCTYRTPGTYTAFVETPSGRENTVITVIDTNNQNSGSRVALNSSNPPQNQGNGNNQNNASSGAGDASFSVRLSASASDGKAPLSVTLSAAITGNANSPKTFDCGNGTKLTLYSMNHFPCKYNAPGSYTASVVVKQGSQEARDSASITVE